MNSEHLCFIYFTIILKKNYKLESHIVVPLHWVDIMHCEEASHITVHTTPRSAIVLFTKHVKMNKIGRSMKSNTHQNEWSSSSHQNYNDNEKHEKLIQLMAKNILSVIFSVKG